MQYLGRTPPPPLDEFIERIWYCSEAPPQAGGRALTSGGALDLIVNLFDAEVRVWDSANPGAARTFSGAVVRGAAMRSFSIGPT